MATIGSLVVHLGVDSRKFSSGLNSARGALSGFSKFAIGAVAGVGSAVAGAFAVKELVGSAREAEQAAKKLSAVLKATGGAAGFSTNEIRRFAGELQGLTNFDDDAITDAAAVMATFKNIRGDVFKDAIRSALDLSSVVEQDLQSSVMQIAKALNDPLQGMTALRRAGVSFTEQQVEMVKALVASNDLLGAQKIILGELEGQFGGAAEGMAEPIKQLQNAFADLKETLGTALLPEVQEMAKSLKVLVDELNRGADGLAKLKQNGKPGVLAGAVGAVADAGSAAKKSFMGLQFGVSAGTNLTLRGLNSISPQASLAKALVPGLNGFIETWEEDTRRETLRLGDEIHAMGQQPWPSEVIAEGVRALENKGNEELRKIREMGPTVNPNQFPGGAGPGGMGGLDIPTVLGLPKVDDLEELRKEADKIRDAVKTPLELVDEEFRKLTTMLDKGLIGDETFSRAIRQALEGLSPDELSKLAAAHGVGLDVTSNKFQAAGAFNLRTAEGQKSAFSALVGAKFSGGKDPQQKVAANTDKMLTHLKTIAEKAKESGEKIEMTTASF